MSCTVISIFHTACTLLSGMYPELEAHSIAWELITFVMQCSKQQLLIKKTVLSPEQQMIILNLLNAHMQQHVPTAYLTERIQFGELTLDIRPPILIPRSETEAWCYKLIAHIRSLQPVPLRILDLCTGSGCIALAIAHALPQATVIGVDISADALKVASQNSMKHNITNCTWIQSDLFAALDTELFDIIVANPPYISYTEWCTLEPSVKLFESSQALIAAQDGYAFIEKIIQYAPHFLKKSHRHTELSKLPQLYIEIGHNQAKKTETLMQQHGYATINAWQDYNGHTRVICGKIRYGDTTEYTA